MRKLIFTILLILAAYVGYQYYFGKEENKTQAHTVVEDTRALIRSVGDLLKDQKESYNNSEIRPLLDQVKAKLQNIRSDNSPRDQQVKDDLRDLSDELGKIDTTKLNPDDKKALKNLIRDLEQETH